MYMLYIQLVSCIRGSMFSWFCICIYEYVAYIYMYHHVSMVLQVNESGFIQYTYTCTTLFSWFCGFMNLDSCNIHTLVHISFYLHMYIHIQATVFQWFHSSGFIYTCFYWYIYIQPIVFLWFHGSGFIYTVYIGTYTCFCGSMNPEPWICGITEPGNHESIFL